MEELRRAGLMPLYNASFANDRRWNRKPLIEMETCRGGQATASWLGKRRRG